MEIGGKGLFTKEIDEAMLAGDIDIAIHSMKDMPTMVPHGIALHAITAREDPRDAFISTKAQTLAALPGGSTVGTASLRRSAQLLHRRPDLKVEPLRGNVDTRLEKLKAGEVDAILLASAGLKRLGRAEEITSVIQRDEILPAVGQGALAATCRADDPEASTLLAALADEITTAQIIAERTLLTVLDGSCHTPIGGNAGCRGDGKSYIIRDIGSS